MINSLKKHKNPVNTPKKRISKFMMKRLQNQSKNKQITNLIEDFNTFFSQKLTEYVKKINKDIVDLNNTIIDKKQ